MTQLSVNLNKAALLRNARPLDIPSVVKAADTCISAGAYGITVHPRPDQRHIRYTDVHELKDAIAGLDVEFNIEGNPFTGKYMELMPEVQPDQATLVPDEPGANTSDHGWELDTKNIERLKPIIEQLKNLDIRVSLFVDPVIETIEAAKKIGADRIELYTEPYAAAFAKQADLEKVTAAYAAAAKASDEMGLGVNAGHDLSLENLEFFCKNVKPVNEVSIGHALFAEAIFMGLQNTVKAYNEILAKS